METSWGPGNCLGEKRSQPRQKMRYRDWDHLEKLEVGSGMCALWAGVMEAKAYSVDILGLVTEAVPSIL